MVVTNRWITFLGYFGQESSLPVRWCFTLIKSLIADIQKLVQAIGGLASSISTLMLSTPGALPFLSRDMTYLSSWEGGKKRLKL